MDVSKHIKRKFTNEMSVPNEIANTKLNRNEFNEYTTSELTEEVIKGDRYSLIIFDNGVAALCFPYFFEENAFLIPEPDPVLIYFNSAYSSYKSLLEVKEVLIQDLINKDYDEGIRDKLYEFYGHASSFVVMLFLALEAHLNRCIPPTSRYKYKGKELDNVDSDSWYPPFQI
ncbi:MAG: hypothetical protein JNK20_07420 [Flavipsychrobacter sp.]|nr:hypothetical protein [Flavipsychrobacter sp.]